jgi:hypothetical protein
MYEHSGLEYFRKNAVFSTYGPYEYKGKKKKKRLNVVFIDFIEIKELVGKKSDQ